MDWHPADRQAGGRDRGERGSGGRWPDRGARRGGQFPRATPGDRSRAGGGQLHDGTENSSLKLTYGLPGGPRGAITSAQSRVMEVQNASRSPSYRTPAFSPKPRAATGSRAGCLAGLFPLARRSCGQPRSGGQLASGRGGAERAEPSYSCAPADREGHQGLSPPAYRRAAGGAGRVRMNRLDAALPGKSAK